MARKKGGGGGANWMDTYGDMVTLLLCFFVLLYSMSTISEDKWKAIVQSFNPSSIIDAAATSGNDGPIDGSDDLGTDKIAMGPEEINAEDIELALKSIMAAIQSFAEENDMEESIQVSRGDGYIFVSFADAVFFDGDSSRLRRDGLEVLDVVAAAIDPVTKYIDELRVMGHTAQARPDRPNEVSGDRRLASNRATNVVIYIQEHCSMDPARLVSEGFGQHRPVDSNNTPEERAHNRRVEMLITGKNIESAMGDALEQYTSLRTGGESAVAVAAAAPEVPAIPAAEAPN